VSAGAIIGAWAAVSGAGGGASGADGGETKAAAAAKADSSEASGGATLAGDACGGERSRLRRSAVGVCGDLTGVPNNASARSDWPARAASLATLAGTAGSPSAVAPSGGVVAGAPRGARAPVCAAARARSIRDSAAGSDPGVGAVDRAQGGVPKGGDSGTSSQSSSGMGCMTSAGTSPIGWANSALW